MVMLHHNNSLYDHDPILECANCGTRAMWGESFADSVRTKIMPRGWSKIENTFYGTAYFHSTTCETVWCSKHEYQAPIPTRIIDAPPEPTELPTVRAETRMTCTCGLGPYTERGMSGHMRSREHAKRMAAQPVRIG